MQRQKPTLVSIIILNWNRPDDTVECLKHVRNLKYTNKEIIVVDNGSNDNSLEILEKEKDILLVKNIRNRGFTGGHIDGLKHAQGEYILILNNDAAIKTNYISEGLKYFQDNSVAAVGGRAYLWNKDYPELSENNPYYAYQEINPVTAEGIFKNEDDGIPREVNTVSGSGVLLRRSVLDQIGYLYEPYFAYYEETDLFARMKRAGYKVLYSPELSIWHKSGSSSTPYFQYRQLFRNRFIFAVRNFDSEYIGPFIKSYVKTGIKSSILRFRASNERTLHKAFSNAFLWNLLFWPNALISRINLHKQLGKSNYSHSIVKEQLSVSIIADLTAQNLMQIKEFARLWSEENGNDARIKLVIVHRLDNIASIDHSYSRNINLVNDKRIFVGQALNLGWLSTDSSYILFAKPGEQPPANEQILENTAQMHPKGANVFAYVDHKEGNTLYESSLQWNLIVRRELLVRTGGLKVAEGTEESLRHLAAYASTWHKSLVIIEARKSGEALSKPAISWKEKQKQIIIEIQQDKSIDKKPSRWSKYIESKYILYHIRNYLRWVVSLRIRTKTKVGRTGRLMIYALSLQRKKIGTELLHIRNEYLKSSARYLNFEDINRRIKIATKENAKNWQDIPVFIICRDRLTPLLQLIEWLEGAGMKRIVLIDNDSLYPPLLNYYENTPYQVISTKQNIGHTVPWSGGIIRTLIPDDYYIVSDPDVIPTKECPKDAVLHFLKLHKKYFLYQKVGFALKIDDIPDYFTLKDSVIAWEKQFWQNPISTEVYEAGIDTTFALYKPFTYKYILHPSLRTGEPYVARHLPWYVDSKNVDPEEKFYRDHVNNKITSWNVDKLPDRYKKELDI